MSQQDQESSFYACFIVLVYFCVLNLNIFYQLLNHFSVGRISQQLICSSFIFHFICDCIYFFSTTNFAIHLNGLNFVCFGYWCTFASTKPFFKYHIHKDMCTNVLSSLCRNFLIILQLLLPFCNRTTFKAHIFR